MQSEFASDDQSVMMTFMAEDELINLRHDVDRHEEAVTQDGKDIALLKGDVREFLHLIRLLDVFVLRQTPGIEVEKAQIEFSTRLRNMLEKHEMAKG